MRYTRTFMCILRRGEINGVDHFIAHCQRCQSLGNREKYPSIEGHIVRLNPLGRLLPNSLSQIDTMGLCERMLYRWEEEIKENPPLR